MKGISHFITGVALATFFPEVVHRAALGSLLPMLGGLGGILPDTLDFKFARYFESFDLEIAPEPEPDPAAIADALVGAMRVAYETGTAQNVVAHTLRLGADRWREYTIQFDHQCGEVVVRIGPVVSTGGVPYAGTEPEQGAREAHRKVGVPLRQTYDAAYKVNIFSGPSFRFSPEDEALVVHFLDWHRRWSHSVTIALIVGIIFGLTIGLLIDWSTGMWAGFVSALGAWGHIMEDQLGYMGSNLFWPLTRSRQPGLGLIHSGDPIPNFLTVWTAVALILFNVDRFSTQSRLPQKAYGFWVIAVPWVILGGSYLFRKLLPRWRTAPKTSLREADIVAEVTQSH